MGEQSKQAESQDTGVVVGQNACQNGLPKAVVEYLLMLMVCVDKIGMWPLILCFLSYQRLVKGQYCPGILTFDPIK